MSDANCNHVGSLNGPKECVREKGHPLTLHTSPSGTSWSAAPPPPVTPGVCGSTSHPVFTYPVAAPPPSPKETP